MIKNKKELIDLVILTLKYENAFKDGFIKYRLWAKRINNIINIYEHNITRAIFVHLVKEKIFEKQKSNRKIEYLFNPYQKKWVSPYDNYDGVVHFD